MSHLDSIDVKGVRSFGQDSSEKIAFLTPLTLILGPNGSGKTTIIECLKYMTSGDMPSPKTGAFLHDPKIAGESSVSGMIEFKFHAVCDQTCVATRRFTATRNAKDEHKTNFSTDAYKIRVNDEEIKKPKWANEMGSLLGVSKKILEDVIFCTQEEADWPLTMSDKQLKNEFDAIFEASQYVKALDAIKDVKKSLGIRIGDYRRDVEKLKTDVDMLKEIRDKISIEEKFNDDQGDKISSFEQQLQPIRGTLEGINMRREEILSLQNKIGNLVKELEITNRNQQELEKNIQNKFTGSSAELTERLQSFDTEAAGRGRDLALNEARFQRVAEKLSMNNDEKSKLLTQQGELKQETKRYEEFLQKRDSTVRELASKYGCEGYSARLSEQQVLKFSQVMRHREDDLSNSINAIEADYKVRESGCQKETDTLNASRTALRTQMQYKREILDTNEKQWAQIKQTLSNVDTSSLRDKISAIQTQLNLTEQKLKEAEEGTDLDKMDSDMNFLQKQKDRLRGEQKALQTEWTNLNLESKARTKLEYLKNDKTAKMSDVQTRKSAIEERTKHVLGYMPAEKLKAEFDKKLRNLSEAIDNTSEHVKSLNSTHTQREQRYRLYRNELNKKEEELQGYKQKLNELIGSQTFNDGLIDLQVKLQQAHDKKGNLSGEHALYKAYTGKLQEVNPPCPLCNRRFTDKSQVEQLIRELQAKVNAAPTSLEQLKHDIGTYQKKVQQMSELKPMMNLEVETIPNLRKYISDLENRVQESSIQLADKSSTLTADRNMAEVAWSVQTDVEIIDSTERELAELNRVILQQESELTGNGSGYCIQDVQTKKDEIDSELERISRNIDQQQQSKNEHMQVLHSLKDRKHELNGEKPLLEQQLEQIAAVEQKKSELERANASLDQEVQDIQQQIQPLVNSINVKVKEKYTLSQERAQRNAEDMGKLNSMRKTHQEVLNYNTELQSYIDGGKKEKLEMNINSVETADSIATHLSTTRDTLAADIDKTKEQQRLQETYRRDLEATLQVLGKEDDISKLRVKIESLEGRLKDVHVDESEVEKLKFYKQTLLRSKEQARQQQLVSNGCLSQLREQREYDLYQNVEVNYRDKMIEFKTTELAHQDMETYYKVLNTAILTYHTSKMKEVNKIMRELWRHTYRGNDIECIEIQLEEEFSSGAKAYNYRVVMTVGGVAIDMKQRCSAGQKVLASLIIRLALAETFCLNCGVLALDEPTTNLDRANIESLAYALSEIIKHRSQQKNFQLIIITHDGAFVEMLGRACSVHNYYKVYKNRQGCSKIELARVQELHIG